jgi:hypothetical protein
MRILCVWIKGRDAVGTVITCTQLNAPMRSGASSATHRRRQQHCRLTRLAARTALLVPTSSRGPQGVAQRCRGPSRRRHSQGMTVWRVQRSSHVEARMGQLGSDTTTTDGRPHATERPSWWSGQLAWSTSKGVRCTMPRTELAPLA